MATHSFAAADVFRPYYGLISAVQQSPAFLKIKKYFFCFAIFMSNVYIENGAVATPTSELSIQLFNCMTIT